MPSAGWESHQEGVSLSSTAPPPPMQLPGPCKPTPLTGLQPFPPSPLSLQKFVKVLLPGRRAWEP